MTSREDLHALHPVRHFRRAIVFGVRPSRGTTPRTRAQWFPTHNRPASPPLHTQSHSPRRASCVLLLRRHSIIGVERTEWVARVVTPRTGHRAGVRRGLLTQLGLLVAAITIVVGCTGESGDSGTGLQFDDESTTTTTTSSTTSAELPPSSTGETSRRARVAPREGRTRVPRAPDPQCGPLSRAPSCSHSRRPPLRELLPAAPPR